MLPACRPTAGGWPFSRTPDIQNFKKGIAMKKIVFAAGLLMISASAHAGTYNYEGITIHVQDGCRSTSCVSVYAPGYGTYHGGGAVKVHKTNKDTARIASAAKKEDAAIVPAGPAPAVAAPAVEATPAKTPEAAPSDAAPAK
jgi:hypothetical protein